MRVNHKLLTKFVLGGMQKNKKTLVPFLVAGTLTVMIFYILTSLAYCPYIYMDGKEAFYGAQTIAIMLNLSSQITVVFAALFIFYANQFMIRGRKKEMALYGVLGMSKRNITTIMVMESVIHACVCIGMGLICGTFLNKLMLLVLYKIIHQPSVDGMLFSMIAFKKTLLVFVVIYAVCLIYNVSSIRVGNPMELLRSDKTGEKEPKIKILSFVIGIVTLAVGYYLALTTNSTFDAINILFVSILLVIIATYCLFIAGSIFILKVLKKNRKFYLKTKNFISVSNLMFRMKHNAAGLASICILSTGVMLLLACGSSLMMLGEKNISDLYPTDIKLVTEDAAQADETAYKNTVRDAADAVGTTCADLIYRKYDTVFAKKTDSGFSYTDANAMMQISDCADMYLVSLENYNHYTNKDIHLSENEVFLYDSNASVKSRKSLALFGNTYQIAGEVDYKTMYYILDASMTLFDRVILVFPEQSQIDQIMGKNSNQQSNRIYLGCNTKDTLTQDEMDKFETVILKRLPDAELHFKSMDEKFFYNLYGGAFFVGIFLAVLFLMATVMIIYYKQMSEGYEDQKRFEILAKVGLTEKEAKRSIKRQVMILFFLPVAVAMLHIIVASKIICLFLKMVLIMDMFTFGMSLLVVCIIFFIVYALVYKVTSHKYYQIVYGRMRDR